VCYGLHDIPHHKLPNTFQFGPWHLLCHCNPSLKEADNGQAVEMAGVKHVSGLHHGLACCLHPAEQRFGLKYGNENNENHNAEF